MRKKKKNRVTEETWKSDNENLWMLGCFRVGERPGVAGEWRGRCWRGGSRESGLVQYRERRERRRWFVEQGPEKKNGLYVGAASRARAWISREEVPQPDRAFPHSSRPEALRGPGEDMVSESSGEVEESEGRTDERWRGHGGSAQRPRRSRAPCERPENRRADPRSRQQARGQISPSSPGKVPEPVARSSGQTTEQPPPWQFAGSQNCRIADKPRTRPAGSRRRWRPPGVHRPPDRQFFQKVAHPLIQTPRLRSQHKLVTKLFLIFCQRIRSSFFFLSKFVLDRSHFIIGNFLDGRSNVIDNWAISSFGQTIFLFLFVIHFVDNLPKQKERLITRKKSRIYIYRYIEGTAKGWELIATELRIVARVMCKSSWSNYNNRWWANKRAAGGVWRVLNLCIYLLGRAHRASYPSQSEGAIYIIRPSFVIRSERITRESEF